MEVRAYDRYREDWPEDLIRMPTLDTLLETSDVLTLHIPSNEDTRGLIGRRQLSRLPAGAVIVNTARGAVLDGAAAGSVVARVADPGLGLLGAGSFATGTLLPVIQAAGGFRFVGVATATGPSSHHAARKFGFGYATTEESDVLADPSVDLVAVLTRHDLHARQIMAALDAGKHVFCEKPPALDEEQLTAVVRAYVRAQAQVQAQVQAQLQAPLQAHVQERGGRLLAVGFNRRFSPMATRMRAFLAERPELGSKGV